MTESKSTRLDVTELPLDAESGELPCLSDGSGSADQTHGTAGGLQMAPDATACVATPDTLEVTARSPDTRVLGKQALPCDMGPLLNAETESTLIPTQGLRTSLQDFVESRNFGYFVVWAGVKQCLRTLAYTLMPFDSDSEKATGGNMSVLDVGLSKVSDSADAPVYMFPTIRDHPKELRPFLRLLKSRGVLLEVACTPKPDGKQASTRYCCTLDSWLQYLVQLFVEVRDRAIAYEAQELVKEECDRRAGKPVAGHKPTTFSLIEAPCTVLITNLARGCTHPTVVRCMATAGMRAAPTSDGPIVTDEDALGAAARIASTSAANPLATLPTPTPA